MCSDGYSTRSVSVSVKSHLTYGVSVCPQNAVTYSAGNEGEKLCGDLPETTVFKSYATNEYSDLPAVSFLRLTHSKAPEDTQQIVNNIQPCPKLCLLMLLTHAGVRKLGATLQLHTRRGQFLCTRIGTVQRNMQYEPRVLHFSAFHFSSKKTVIY